MIPTPIRFATALLTLCCVLAAASPEAAAQGALGSVGQPPGMKASLVKLFGEFTAFSAKADVNLKDATGKETLTMVMDLAVLDGKIRSEIDLGNLKSDMMPAAALASMKQMGMDRMVTVIRPDQKKMVLMYPGLKAYADMPLDEEQAKAANAEPKIERTELGKESVAGRECVKTKVKITDASGESQEGLVWLAPDLKNFPVQMQFAEEGSTVTMRFADIKTTKPDAAGFDAPSGFKKHAGVQELMQAAAMRMLGGSEKAQ